MKMKKDSMPGLALAIILFLVIFLAPGPTVCGQSSQDCQTASRMVSQAFDLGQSHAVNSEQKVLLNKALTLCPQHPEAHNNLAVILEEENDYPQALFHYQQAVDIRPDFAEAWFGLGEVYYKSGRFTQSLEAYLKACGKDKEAGKKVGDLLNTHRYSVSEAGEIMNKESLLILFDKKRRAEINRMIAQCGYRADVQPVFVFRNILFDVASATIKTESTAQIQEIGAALKEVPTARVVVSGHTDKQCFRGVSQEESDRRNIQLSRERADSVARELARMSISADRLKTAGYGPTKPEEPGDNPETYAKNRRVTIEVLE